MDKKYFFSILATAITTAALFAGANLLFTSGSNTGSPSEQINSSDYMGEENRLIKSLSSGDLEALKAGTGEAFGGMAKLAELNGYPGPRHVLDMGDKIGLSEEQKGEIEAKVVQMKAETVPLGEQIIAIEQKTNDAFSDRTITNEMLKENMDASGRLYGQLRYTHLKYHLEMINILTPEQVKNYNEFRGYGPQQPNGQMDGADTAPEGYDQEMWKMHHGGSSQDNPVSPE